MKRKSTKKDDLITNNQTAVEEYLPVLCDNVDDDWELDEEESEYISRDEFLYAIDEISTKMYLQQLQLEELQSRVEETPQQLVCDTKPDKTKKICVAHYNLGLAPTYLVKFRRGHDTDKPVTLCIYVQRTRAEKTLQYSGEIIGFPAHLEPGTSALFSSSVNDMGKVTFELVGLIEDRSPDILSFMQAQQKKIDELESQIEELADMLKQSNAAGR